MTVLPDRCRFPDYVAKSASGARRPWMGQRREDGSPRGPQHGEARVRFTTAVPRRGHAQADEARHAPPAAGHLLHHAMD